MVSVRRRSVFCNIPIQLIPVMAPIKTYFRGLGEILLISAIIPARRRSMEYVSTCCVECTALDSQKMTRNEACPTRAVRADVTFPKAALVCAPVTVLNTAELFTPENCVWLNAL